MTKSKIFLYFCLFFIFGIFFSSFIAIPKNFIWGFLFLSLFLIFFLFCVFPQKNYFIFGFFILFFIFGVLRYQIEELRLAKDKFLKEYAGLEDKSVLIVKVLKEPEIGEKSQKLTVGVLDNKYFENTKILIIVNNYPEYQYKDKLKIKGVLEEPFNLEEFNYKNYLKKEKILWIMKFPDIELLERGSYENFFSFVYANIIKFKHKVREVIYDNLPLDEGSILAAMILGDKRMISDDLKLKLNISGIRHITAVSGLHIAILTSFLMAMLIGIGFWRQQAFWFSIILISLFIIMTGLQSSAIRAGIMAGLFLFGQYLGREGVSSRFLIMAAALMLSLNPFLLRLDIGFQLSFLAVLGIIYFNQHFENIFKFIPYNVLRSMLSVTFSAYIFTAPILIYNFGYLSVVAPITNILIIPFLPLIMILGFLLSIFGLIHWFLGKIFTIPLYFLLNYLIRVNDFFSQSVFSYLVFENVDWIWLIICYLFLTILVWRLNKKSELKFMDY